MLSRSKVYKPKLVCYTAKSEEEHVSQIFVDALSDEIKDIYYRFKEPAKMFYGEKEREIFEKSKCCWLCEREFSPADLEKGGLGGNVRDHCHYTGRFRGAALNDCNLSCRKPGFMPVIFHNMSGRDSHLFVKNLGVKEANINCIPKNEEIYISFSKEVVVNSYLKKAEECDLKGKDEDSNVKRKLRFIDTFKFMATGLDKLVATLLTTGRSSFKNTQRYFKDIAAADLQGLLFRKGVFPYEYMNSFERLDETELPPKNWFYSRLNDEHTDDEDYEHAQNHSTSFKTRFFAKSPGANGLNNVLNKTIF